MQKIIMLFLLSFCATTAVAQNFKFIEVTLENGLKSRFPVYHNFVRNEVKVMYEGDSFYMYSRIYANGKWFGWDFMGRIQAKNNLLEAYNIINKLETISIMDYSSGIGQVLIVPDGEGTSEKVGNSHYIVRRKIYTIVTN